MADDNYMQFIPPQNLEAERAVIGASLLNQKACTSALESLKAEDFYKIDYQFIFKAIEKLRSKNTAVDLVTVADELKRADQLDRIGGTGSLAAVCESVASLGNIKYYTDIVRNRSMLRSLIDICGETAKESRTGNIDLDTLLSQFQLRVSVLGQRSLESAFIEPTSSLEETFKRVNRVQELGEAVTGVASGFTQLDTLTSGFQKGEFIIIGGRPSMGKTAVALNMLEYMAINPHGLRLPVAMFSLEMSVPSLMTRLLCSHAKVNSQKVQQGKITLADWQKLFVASKDIESSKIFLDDEPAFSVNTILTKARRLKSQNPDLGLIIIDYIHLIGEEVKLAGNANAAITYISKRLKNLAKELKIPVIGLSQLSRNVENRPGSHRPILSDLRDSGSLEQDADLIIFVWRAAYHSDQKSDNDIHTLSELILSKNRNGPIGTATVKFIPDYARFENVSY